MATTTQRTIQQQLDLAAEIVGGKAWGCDKLKPRIYVGSRRDVKAFFDFSGSASYTSPDQPADAVHCLGGAAFHVYIDDCGQHPNWYAAQKRKVVEANWKRGLAIDAFIGCDDEALAREIMELDDVTAEQVNEAAGHFVNGRVAEARAALGL
jgi:hypothetical protein